MKSHSLSVPKTMQDRYDSLVQMTDAFCRDHLDEEYRDLARAMTAALCRKRPSPLATGKANVWACGIIYALGQINFLSDKSFKPYMMMSDVCAEFGISQSTGAAKAKIISSALRTGQLDHTWMVPSLLARDPSVWMAEVDGYIIDLRHAPRELQVIAFDKGIIPYIPADQ